MAEAPRLLAGYSALWKFVYRSRLTPTERQVVHMTANVENDCQSCMAGHTTLARMQKFAEPTVASLRGGTAIPDAKREALHAFTTAVERDRGHGAGGACWLSRPR